MSETEPDTTVASHTLTYLRRIDRRVDQLTELVVRQQELIGRLDRDMREGFSIGQRDMQGVQRDIREMKSDMVLMENRIVSAIADGHHASARMTEAEDRLAVLEAARRDL